MTDEREMWSMPNGGVLYNVHPQSTCDGTPCWIHNPSDHHMKDWPMIRRGSGLMERECLHGSLFVDPDYGWYLRHIEHLEFETEESDCGCDRIPGQ